LVLLVLKAKDGLITKIMKYKEQVLEEYKNRTVKELELYVTETFGTKQSWFQRKPEVFLAQYAACNVRLLHEVIHHDRKCKLYLDIEKHENGAEKIDEAGVLAKLEKDLWELLKEQKGMKPEYMTDYILLRDHRPGTFSLHVVWQKLFFKTPCALKIFLSPLKPEHPMIDYMVYPITVPKTLRMAWSTKNMEREALMLPVVNGEPVREFDPELFKKTLVSMYMGDGLFVDVVEESNPKKARQEHPKPNPEFQQSRAITDTFHALEIIYGIHEVSGFVVLEGWRCYAKTIYCPFARRKHRSNRMSVTGTKNGNVYLKCMDEDCNERVVTNINWLDARRHD